MAGQGLAKLFNSGLKPVVKNFKGLSMAKFVGKNGKEFVHLYDDMGNLVSTKVRDGAQISKLNIFYDQFGSKVYQKTVKNSPYGFKNGTTTARVSDFNDIKNKIEITKPNGWFGDVTCEYYVNKPIVNTTGYGTFSSKDPFEAALVDFLGQTGSTEITLNELNKLNRYF